MYNVSKASVHTLIILDQPGKGRKAELVMTHQKAEGFYFEVDIEGEVKTWNEQTITPKQVAELGGWDVSEDVIVIELDDNTERTLEVDETVELKSGLGFAKRPKFKRG